MLSVTALAVLFASQGSDKPIELGRKFTLGEKLVYVTRAQFTEEQRAGALQTFIPEDFEISYRHTIEVKKMKADGIAEILYTRPHMTIVEGDTGESQAKSTTEKVDWKLQIDLSPINEVLEVKDLNPPKKDDKKGAADGIRTKLRYFGPQTQADNIALGLLFEFLNEVQRTAFFVGSLDTGLDLSPKTPFEEVTKGSTWKKTVGYSPQKLKGRGDKQAVQRLDYTYEYQGMTKSKEGKDVHRIQAKVKLDTDLIEFAKQLSGNNNTASFLKSVPLKLDATIDFDLDPTTMHMTKALATSAGSFAIMPKGAEQAAVEDRFKGRTTVKLESRTIGAPVKSPTTPAKSTGKGKNGG